MNQESHANKTGNNLEKFVNNLLIDCGYRQVDKNNFDLEMYFDKPVFTRQYYIGQSIYETKQYCDFIRYNPTKYPNKLCIEVKWQARSGSVDEKYPYLVLNIEKREIPTIIILDGSGYKRGAKDWLKEQVNPEDKLRGVYNMEELQKLANKGNL